MIIGIGCDHGGYQLKELVKSYLQEKYQVIDYGCNSLDSCDYPKYASSVCQALISEKINYGVLICTTGVGMSICANKYSGVRAALVFNEDMTSLTRRHNNSNVLCIAAKYTTFEEAKKYVDIFFTTDFEGGRHLRRVEMIEKKGNI